MPPTSQNTIHHKVNFWQLPNWILHLFLLLISWHQYTCLQLLLSDWSPLTPIFLGLQILFHQMLYLINIYSEEGEKSNYSKFGKFTPLSFAPNAGGLNKWVASPFVSVVVCSFYFIFSLFLNLGSSRLLLGLRYI